MFNAANIHNYFQSCIKKAKKIFLWGYFAKILRKQGERYVLTGGKVCSNRERDKGLPDAGVRPHELGRAPLYIGAPALIYPSGRSKPIFILFDYLSLGSRASGGFRVLSKDADGRLYKGYQGNSWLNRASIR